MYTALRELSVPLVCLVAHDPVHRGVVLEALCGGKDRLSYFMLTVNE